MTAADDDWARRYRAALAAHMGGCDRHSCASDPLTLGRAALAAGRGPIDLHAANEFALTQLIASMPPEAIAGAMIRAHAFMTRAFAPFETAHHGWHAAGTRLHPVGERLDAGPVKRTAAQRSEERFRAIFTALTDGIFVAWPRGRFTEVNRAGHAMFGYEPGELIGADIGSISSGVPPYTRRDAIEWYGKAANTGRPQRFDWHCKAKDGGLFWASVSIQVTLLNGERAVLALVRDITERRAAEARLRQAEKMDAIGNLTGGMAHDFNNLLGVVIGNLELAREQLAGNAPVVEMVSEALEAAWRGADLTRRLLAFARRQPLRPRVIDLNELTASAVRGLGAALGERIEVTLALGAQIWPVNVDPGELERALTHLATNARDAMPRGGSLSISTMNATLDAAWASQHGELTPGEFAEGDYAVIEVTDTGLGMPPDVAARIFEPFFTTKETGKGTGLGLSMVFGFIRQSGGHIDVRSEPDAGTSFRLYLPRALQPPTEHAASPVAAADGSGELVLLVEDNAPMRRIALRQLRELGYRALEAERASDAMTILQRADIDLLLTDIVMPGAFDGIELARRARQCRPLLKIVLTSGFPDVRAKAASALPPDLRLLSKPYSKAALARVLREAFADCS